MIPELEFAYPYHREGTNLTVTRGLKWYNHNVAHINGVGVVMLQHRILPFDKITDEDLRLEHNPLCRTVSGLLEGMQDVYADFSTDELVTLVYYEV